MNNKDLKSRAKVLVETLETQDVHHTAQPVGFIIQDYILEPTIPGNGDFSVFYHSDSGESYHGETYENILNQIIDDEEWSEEDREKLLEEIEENSFDASYNYRSTDNNFFLTSKAAKEFLEANHYHYHEKARVFCIHCWRNDEMKLVLDIIKEYAKQ